MPELKFSSDKLTSQADKEAKQNVATPAGMKAPIYVPEKTAEFISSIHKGGQQAAQVRPIFINTVTVRLNDVAYWEKVKRILENKYKSGIDSKILAMVPEKLRDRFNLTLFGGEKAVIYEAFLNQLAFMSYSNDIDLSDVKGMPSDAAGSTKEGAAAILNAAGYMALPTIHGLWGFQMRVFKPKKGAKAISDKTVVAFRGTEGVKGTLGTVPRVNSSPKSQKDNESYIDTMTDFVPYPTGYSQYEANRDKIIDPIIKSLGENLVAVGHSLGGALAQLAAAKYPSKFTEVQTFQGAKIEAGDVAKAEAANSKLNGTYYSVNGDVVPGSGQKSIQGEKHRFERTTPMSMNVNNADAVGGHNSPIMLMMLRDFRSKNLLSKDNALTEALAKYGSRDPVEGARLNPTSHDFKAHPNSEDAKQDILGSWQKGTFIGVYKNNVIYNIYVERAMEILRGTKSALAEKLIALLSRRYDEVTKTEIKHTPSSKIALAAIFDKPIAEAKEDLERKKILKDSATPIGYLVAQKNLADLVAQKKDCENFGALDPAIKKENLARLRFKMADLWYSANPADENVPLYRKVKPLWETTNRM